MAQIPTQIVILGAGYAGMLATTRLAGRLRQEIRRGQVAVTLINRAEVFVERLRLHQLAANQTIPQRCIVDILDGTGVAFVQGTVTALDTARRTMAVQTVAGPRPMSYDYLLLALGSTIDQDSVPGVREHAYVLTPDGPRSAPALREALIRLNASGQGGRLLICGGGATGIEAAAEIAEAYPGLRLALATEGALGEFTAGPVAAYMRRTLEGLGVTVRDQTTVSELTSNEARTAGGNSIPFDVCLWAGGFAVPGLARESGLAVNDCGQVWIDPFMRSTSHPEIFAAGDAAQPVEAPGTQVRMAAFTAVLMGAHGADCLAAVIQGRRPKPFSFAYAGQAIALGRRRAIGFNNYPNDIPNRPHFTGRLGYEIREFFVRLLAYLPLLERRWPGSLIWLGRGRYAARRREANARTQRPAAVLRRQPEVK